MLRSHRYDHDALILAAFTSAAAVCVTPRARASDESVVCLRAVARDFRPVGDPAAHPDFGHKPDHGLGLYERNIGLELDDRSRPVFVGGGFKVSRQGMDASGRPVPWHLQNARYDAGPAASVPETGTTAVTQDDRGRDAYEVSFVSVTYRADGTSAWTYHVRELPGGRDLSHFNVRLDPDHKVVAGTTPGYDHGVDGSTGFFGIKWDVVDAFSAGDFTVVLDGHVDGLVAPEGVLTKSGKKGSEQTAEMFVPDTVLAPVADATLVPDASLGDEEGDRTDSDDGAIESADSFSRWYRDEPGVNMSSPVALTMLGQPDGTYLFDSDKDTVYRSRGGFYPVDGLMLGDDASGHNQHFTVEARAYFVYEAGKSQFVRLTATGDTWLFIDGRLAVDLGGMHAPVEQHVDLDRLGLQDGRRYRLDLFTANRGTDESRLRIHTNIRLDGGAVVATPMSQPVD